MRAPILFSSVTLSLFAFGACSQSHDNDDAGGPIVHGDVGPPDAPVTLTYDSGPPGTFRDAGVHAAADVGPPGDGAGGTWTGYIEAFTFPSGSDDVRIVFDSDARSGTVYFGMGDAPPPADDPNLGYPPGFGYGAQTGSAFFVAEGFGYRFSDATVTASRVQLDVSLGSLWAEWCSLQIPVETFPDAYGCVPNTGFSSGDPCSFPDPVTHEPTPIDCGRLALCGVFGGGACQCTATDCTAGPGDAVSFDFHVTGNDGTGTVSLSGMHNVYFTR